MLKPHPAYGIDLPKNVTELYGTNGYIVTAYTYSPHGLVTTSGSVTQPIQWSSEYSDTDLGLVYYNYRHYNPLDGRWTGRDKVHHVGENNLYQAFANIPESKFDLIGNAAVNSRNCNCIICNSHLRENATPLMSAIKDLNEKGCLKTISCVEMSSKTSGRVRYEEKYNVFVIELQCNAHTSVKKETTDTLHHELIHVLDRCIHKIPTGTCDGSLVTEIRAYSFATCKDISSAEQKKRCVWDGVKYSSRIACAGTNLEARFEALYAKFLEIQSNKTKSSN